MKSQHSLPRRVVRIELARLRPYWAIAFGLPRVTLAIAEYDLS